VGAAAVASFLAAVLTEIYLCGVCSCQQILRRSGRPGERSTLVRCVVGRGCVIGDGCELSHCYLWDGVVIEDGVKAERALFAEKAVIGAGATVEAGCMVGRGCVIGAVRWQSAAAPASVDPAVMGRAQCAVYRGTHSLAHSLTR
jgi:UDP-3-O-[3-hydroxymyristoyl] glucosamine N-acyltransferase